MSKLSKEENSNFLLQNQNECNEILFSLIHFQKERHPDCDLESLTLEIKESVEQHFKIKEIVKGEEITEQDIIRFDLIGSFIDSLYRVSLLSNGLRGKYYAGMV